MKMRLKDRIALSQKILFNCDYQKCMDSNDKVIVFYASAMVGSRLSRSNNDILMGRNAVPNRWHSNSILSDCIINSSFKKAYAQIVEYIECNYNITPGRVFKLLDILSCGKTEYSRERMNLINNEILHRYLRNLNALRIRCKEMDENEIYDFSFDMVYNFINELSLSEETLSLSLMIMYWIQRENELIPLALACSKDEFLTALGTRSEDPRAEREIKKEFRQFMRKSLDLHLKEFVGNGSKDSEKKFTSRDRILELIKDNPTHTAKTMASCLGLSVQAIHKQIAFLKDKNRLMRIGPDNGGRWKVLEE